MTLVSTEVHETQGRRGTVDGMRREWNFSLTFASQAARILMQLSPNWEINFIDPRDILQLDRLDRDVKHCPMMPALCYTDLSAVMKPNNELWTEIPKRVSILYSHIPPDMTLAAYCIRSVQHVLSNPHVVSVDGSTNLSNLRVGAKLRCQHRLGGRRSFHFTYDVSVKSQLIKDKVYAIGTIINQRGYLCTVQCSEADELDGYVSKNFLPQFANPSKFTLDQDIIYEEMTSTILKEQQELFGELRYSDADAAVSFSIPMHPMRIRPDFSPTQTVGVGSIACMTLELDVHQKLIDDFAEADITGMPKYKINQAILFLDVEDVVRMGYPRIMSTEQYSHLKTKRLLDIFGDAKVVGTPVTNRVGIRTGRSRTVTFTYEPFNTVVKAMIVSSIVGSCGLSAVFFTKLGGGLFDAHLYLYQQLLQGVKFDDQTAAKSTFSRFRAVNVRLVDQNMPRTYMNAPVDEKQTMERHLKYLRELNDGRVEGAIAVPVPPEEGGLERPQHKGRHKQQAQDNNSGPRFSLASNMSAMLSNGRGSLSRGSASPDLRMNNNRNNSGETSTGAIDRPRLSVFSDGEPISAAGYADSDDGETNKSAATLDAASSHSGSMISVTSIAHLCDRAEYDKECEETVSPDNAAGPPHGGEGAAAPSGVGADTVDSPLTADRQGSAMAPTATAGAAATPPQLSDLPLPPPHSPPRGEGRRPSSSGGSTGSRAAGTAGADAERAVGQRLSLTTAASERESCFGDSPHAIPAKEEEEEAPSAEEQERRLREALKGEEADVYFGPSLHDVYVRACDMQRCRPNSYLLKKLPSNPRFTNGVEEIDLSSNYVGRTGFVAVLNILEHLPRLKSVYFNDMSLDNVDAENLCEVLSSNSSVQAVYLRNNNKITLPSTRYFTRLLRVNPRIEVLALDGTRLGESVIRRLHEDAQRNATCNAEQQQA